MAKDHGIDVGTGTISVLVQDKDPFEDLADVSHRNVAVMVAIVHLMLSQEQSRSTAELEDKLFKGLPKEWPRERLLRESMPLYVYSVVERNLAKLLGNPAALLSAAMFGSVRSDFGERTLWVFNLLRTVTRFVAPVIATPAFFFQHILPAISRLFNRNKVTEVVEADWRRTVVRYTRAFHGGRVLRRPQGDIFSMLWWAPGFTAGVVTWWYKEGARIFHRLVELDPRDVFEACAPFVRGESELHESGDHLYFRSVPIAQRVKLYAVQNDNGTRYYSAVTATMADHPEDFREGWKILLDVEVVDYQGKRWAIVQQGETYCAEAGCSLVEYDYEPRQGWRRWLAPMVAAVYRLFKLPLRGLLLLVGWCIRWLDDRDLREWERARLAELETTLELFAREHAASLREFEEAVRGDIEEIRMPDCVVVRIDFEGHTRRRNQMGTVALRQVLRPFWETVFDFDVNPVVQRGRLPRELSPGDVVVRFGNHTGDGGYIFLYNAPLPTLVQIAVTLAGELHEAAERVWSGTEMPALPLRVTVCAGEVELVAYGRRRTPQDPDDNRRVLVRFFAEGTPLDNCARLDVVAKKVRAGARASGQDAHWMTLMPFDLFRCAEHAEVDGYEDLGVIDVRDMGPTHLVRVVHQADQRVDWSSVLVELKK